MIKSIQIFRAVLSIILGNFISIITDFLLSFFGPISGIIFYPKYFGVFLGSIIAGFVCKKNGWVIGLIISIIHIIYIALILSYPDPRLSETSTKVDWLSLVLPSILMLLMGLVGGLFGTRIAGCRERQSLK